MNSVSIDWFSKVVIRPKTRCWIWTGMRRERPKGSGSPTYGAVRIDGKTRSTHRLSYEQHKGPIPTGLVVMHSCDRGLCVNPDHLSVGTPNDNIQDCIRKGRRRSGKPNPPRGERCTAAKLTEAQVREIRANPLSGRKIGKLYGVSQVLISKIKRRDVWAHLT